MMSSVSTFESQLISLERCNTFTQLDIEKESEKAKFMPKDWLKAGEIKFENYFVKYRPNLPNVIKDLSLTIEGGYNVGVVGRTGSGKSTLFNAILRLLQASEGRILIDSTDIADLPLDSLRQSITIIP